MSTNAIEARGLSKSFRMHTQRRTSFKERVVRGSAPGAELFWALKDASFDVPSGSSLGIIGHNGSGKSTALKVLTGIYRPTTGTVRVEGSVSALLEVGAGFHPELTGRENIRLNATILGFSARQVSAMMDEIIDFAGIGAHIDGPIKHYSSGMYLRLGFAVAVMVRPQILIVDEVIAVGDEEFQRKCYEHLHRLRREGTTMVIVSHGLAHITDLCDSALWLDQGEVKALGPSREVVREYLDAVNQREAERVSEHFGLPDDTDEPDGRVRRGTGEARILRIDFLDESGDPSDLLLSGRQGTVRLHIAATTGLDQVSVSLIVSDENELIVTRADSQNQLPSMRLPSGAGYVDFVADPVLLAGGKYSVRVELLADGRLVDAVDQAAPFTVRAPEVEVLGIFSQPGTWRADPGFSQSDSTESRESRPGGA